MFLFLDTETHSLHDPIMIQLAYKASTQEEYFQALYATGGEKIDLHAMAVHHLTEKHLEGKPNFNDSIEDRKALASLLGSHVLVAHNAKFDVGVLQNHSISTPRQICTLKLARYLYPELEAHKQQYLRYYFGFDFYGDDRVVAHDAFGDVLVLEKLFERMYADFQEAFPDYSEEELIDNMIEISERPSILHMCRFGKHKGTLWSEVPHSYLDWMVNKSNFDDEDVLYTAKFYLEQES